MPEQVGLPPPPLWPFPATQEITEVLEWRNDILTSRAGEQRIALRPRPREIVTFRHRLDALGMARIDVSTPAMRARSARNGTSNARPL